MRGGEASVVSFLLGAHFIMENVVNNFNRTGELRSRCFPACNFSYVLVGLRKYPPSTKKISKTTILNKMVSISVRNDDF